jgi:Putative bacterial sensory transduction regulator
MGKAEDVRHHVETVCRAYLGVDELAVDHDGDIPVAAGEWLYYITVLDGDVALVRVYSHLLRDVEASPALLGRLNEINQGIVSARVFWHDGNVIAATEIVAESMGTVELAHACWSVQSLMDWAPEDLDRRFGNRDG